jgi:curved DNA-binding protein CbpA
MPQRTRLDPYAILGIPPSATPLQVARAHRRLAKRFHPDLHPGEDVSERMRRINDAWSILSSAARRAEYDAAHPNGTTPGGHGHWAASRQEIHPSPPTTAETWASWRATAAETRAAPRTRRQPGERPIPPTRRPSPMQPATRSFRDSGWAALIVAVGFLLLLMAAVVAGRLV